MFSFFRQNQNPPSLISMLSTAAGWFNPFNISPANARKLFYLSYCLNQAATGNAAGCFQSLTDGTKYVLYWLSETSEEAPYSLSPTENYLINETVMKCPISRIEDAHACEILAQLHHTTTTAFGHCYFGGNRAVLYTLHGSPQTCVVDVIGNNTVTGYGCPTDILATIGIVLGAASCAAVVYGASSLFSRQNKDENNTEASALFQLPERSGSSLTLT